MRPIPIYRIPHPEAASSVREVRFRDLLPEGLVLVEACDGQKPAQLKIAPARFPWKDFGYFLAQGWRTSKWVPPQFKPLRRIDEAVIQALMGEAMTHAASLEILKSLRKNGFLPAVRGAKASASPQGQPKIRPVRVAPALGGKV